MFRQDTRDIEYKMRARSQVLTHGQKNLRFSLYSVVFRKRAIGTDKTNCGRLSFIGYSAINRRMLSENMLRPGSPGQSNKNRLGLALVKPNQTPTPVIPEMQTQTGQAFTNG